MISLDLFTYCPSQSRPEGLDLASNSQEGRFAPEVELIDSASKIIGW